MQKDFAEEHILSYNNEYLSAVDTLDGACPQNEKHRFPPKGTHSLDAIMAKAASSSTLRSTSDWEVASNATKISPNDDDVLLGRGRRCREHPANKRLRNLVCQLGRNYDDCCREEKTDLSTRVVEIIKTGGATPARFLKFNKSSSSWIEIRDEVARLKVSHLFRDFRRQRSTFSANRAVPAETKETSNSVAKRIFPRCHSTTTTIVSNRAGRDNVNASWKGLEFGSLSLRSSSIKRRKTSAPLVKAKNSSPPFLRQHSQVSEFQISSRNCLLEPTPFTLLSCTGQRMKLSAPTTTFAVANALQRSHPVVVLNPLNSNYQLFSL